LEKLKNDLTVIEDQIKAKKIAIDEHNESMKRYIKQQETVRNNREFNSLTKESCSASVKGVSHIIMGNLKVF
jgi:predicted  nucleic acid-binding Zn-ribbon protein